MSQNLMRIGQLSCESRVTPRAIRYYERLGLIPPPWRSEANYRLFDPIVAERLRFISSCRALGFSITEIEDLLKVMDNPDHTCAQVSRLAEHHITVIDSKLHNLGEMRATLTEYLSHCTDQDVNECALLDILKQTDNFTRITDG